jgi:hypothetical protein
MTMTMTRSGAVRDSLWAVRRALGWTLLVVGTAAYIYGALIRPWHLRWGATDAELAAVLPGDQLVDGVTLSTRAVTIHAPPEAIWPWLAQLGQAKGGFYSYTALENLLGCEITNADVVVADWQQVRPGDQVLMAPSPDAPPAFLVASVEPGRALVLGHHEGLSRDPASPWSDSWQFVIEPVDAGTSRLIVRSRAGPALWWTSAIEPGVFIMEQGMLRGIKERAERLAGQLYQ